MKQFSKRFFASLLIFCTLWAISSLGLVARGQGKEENKVVNVYSSRHYSIDERIYQDFTQQTGIQVRVVAGDAGETVERAAAEGPNTQADLFFVTGADILAQLKARNVLAPFPKAVADLVPKGLRDPDRQWLAVSKRLRIIVYDKSRTPTVTSYEDLVQGDAKIAIRSSSNSYNRMLLASLIYHHGEEAARQWVRDLVAHMARAPQGNDRSQAKAVAAGLADYAVINSYYLGLLLRSQDAQEVATGEKLAIIFPNQSGRGAHVNVSGIGLSKYARNREAAISLAKFLLSEPSQRRFTEENAEYPVNPQVPPSALVASWGSFREDLPEDFNAMAEFVPLGARIADEEGWK